jgi:TRAP-type C4-dicarboxylate transport system permease small subunit
MKKIALIIWKIPLILQKLIMVGGGGFVGILIFVEVFLRYVLGSPLFGIEELILFIGMWLYFMGASYGAFERTHIKAELINIWCKNERSLAILRTAASIITVALSLVLVSWTYPFFIWELVRGGTSQALLLPNVLCKSAIFFGSVLMSVYFITELIDNILLCMGKRQLFISLTAKDS